MTTIDFFVYLKFFKTAFYWKYVNMYQFECMAFCSKITRCEGKMNALELITSMLLKVGETSKTTFFFFALLNAKNPMMLLVKLFW